MDSPTPQRALTAPEAVEQFAARHHLGDLVDIRPERSTGAMVGGGLAIAAVGLVVTIAIRAVNAAQDAAASSGGTTHHILAPTAAVVVIGLAAALRGLLIGTRTHYLFTGGLLHRRRSGMRAVRWAQVSALHTTYGKDRGNVVGYRVDGPERLSILVPLKRPDGGRDPFVDELLALAAHHDRPIH